MFVCMCVLHIYVPYSTRVWFNNWILIKATFELRDVFRQVLHHIETLPFKECFMNFLWIIDETCGTLDMLTTSTVQKCTIKVPVHLHSCFGSSSIRTCWDWLWLNLAACYETSMVSDLLNNTWKVTQVWVILFQWLHALFWMLTYLLLFYHIFSEIWSFKVCVILFLVFLH